MKNRTKKFLLLACLAMIVVACSKSPKEINDMDQVLETEEIEAVEENLDKATELLIDDTEKLEEEVEELLKGI